MNKNISVIKFPLSLPDSELQSYQYLRQTNEIVVKIVLWNEQHMELHFCDVIFFIDHCDGDVIELCQSRDKSDYMNKAVTKAYEKVPQDHPYKHYQFMTHGNEPSIEIICEHFEAFIDDIVVPIYEQ